MKNISRLHNRGFTLVELLVVIAIIGILSTIGLVSFRSATMRARDGKRTGDINQIRSALELYRSANTSYPATTAIGTMMSALTTGQYISQPTPSDPLQGRSYVYTANGTGSQYCLCAQLEVTTAGNATSNGGSNGGACQFGTTNPAFYCVANP